MGNMCGSRSNRRGSYTDFEDEYDRYPGGRHRGRHNQVGPYSEMPSYQNSFASVNYVGGELRLGHQAPKWTAPAVFGNGEMRDISLDDFKGRWVVFFFYPMDFTFVCPTEIVSFSDRHEEFKAIDCEVIAASTDSKYSHFAWISTSRSEGGLGKLEIPLVADKNCEIARKYGIYKSDEGISWRGLFIIDSEQKLRQITINDNAVGRSVDETLRLVQAFQYADKYGEVCPANWKPGEKGIKINNAIKIPNDKVKNNKNVPRGSKSKKMVESREFIVIKDDL